MESLLHLLEAPDSLTFAPLSKASPSVWELHRVESMVFKMWGLELESWRWRICADSGGCLLVFMACGFGDYMVSAGWLNVFFLLILFLCG